MITGEYAFIRFSEPDDASFLRDLYLERPRRAALLDARREPLMPNTREIHEMLARKDAAQGLLYTVEDTTGALQGWCGLRGMNHEARYGEMVLIFKQEENYEAPIAHEALRFLLDQAFGRIGLHKIIALCLDTEPALARFLAHTGFVCAGAQRDALFTGGAWYDLRTFTLRATDYVEAAATAPSGTVSP